MHVQWPENAVLRVRVALHTGECEERNGDYFGPTVNRASRLAAIGHGGQVLASQPTVAAVRRELPRGTHFVSLGFHELKDLRHPVQVFQVRIDELPASFPPLRLQDQPTTFIGIPRPTNLKIPASTLIGRDNEVTQVASLTSRHRLVTLIAAGGVGKTRLALAVGEARLESVSDGVWFVDLTAASDSALLTAQVIAELNIAGRSNQESLDTVLDVLATQHRLLILDNCEHLLEGCATLIQSVLSRCPHIRFLCTSREALRIDGETIFQVPCLSLPADDDVTAADIASSGAGALFVERARSIGIDLHVTDDNAPVIASICRRLDGMPLALELAAARLRTFSVHQILERLEHRFELLTGGSRIALPRHQTLSALVEWSFSLLGASEQALFRRLSVFADGFTLEAVESVCPLKDIPRRDIPDLLASLVDKSLVVAESHAVHVRFRLHETLREYGRDRLRDTAAGQLNGNEPQLIADTHAAHYLSFALRAESGLSGPRVKEVFESLHADDMNLRAAVQHALSSRELTDLALDQFWTARRYWMHSDRQPAHVVELLRAALERKNGEVSPRQGARSHFLIAGLLFSLDRRRQLEECSIALALAHGAGDLTLEALCLASYGSSLSQNGRDDGRVFAEQALVLARTTGVAGVLCEVINGIQWVPDDLPKHLALLREGIQIAHASRDTYRESMLHEIYALYVLMGGPEGLGEARRSLERALDLLHGGFGTNALALETNLGFVLLQEGDVQRASDTFVRLLRLVRLRGNRTLNAYLVLAIALASTRLAEPVRAAALHGGADSMRSEFSVTWETMEAELRDADLAELRALLGDEFDRRYADGFAMSHDDVITLALT